MDTDGSIDNAIKYVTDHTPWFIKLDKNPLIDVILEHLSVEQLMKLHPELLQGATQEHVETFLSKLDTRGSVRNAIQYVTKNATWFRIKRDKLLQFICNSFSGDQLRQLPPEIFHNFPREAIESILLKMNAGDAGRNNVIDYVKQHAEWFHDSWLLKEKDKIIPLILERYSGSDLDRMQVPAGVFKGAITTFLAGLDIDGSADKAIQYLTSSPS